MPLSDCWIQATAFIALVYYLELEEVLSIVITDIFNHLIYAVHLRYRNFSVLYITSYQITQGTAEVFVTWVRKE